MHSLGALGDGGKGAEARTVFASASGEERVRGGEPAPGGQRVGEEERMFSGAPFFCLFLVLVACGSHYDRLGRSGARTMVYVKKTHHRCHGPFGPHVHSRIANKDYTPQQSFKGNLITQYCSPGSVLQNCVCNFWFTVVVLRYKKIKKDLLVGHSPPRFGVSQHPMRNTSDFL